MATETDAAVQGKSAADATPWLNKIHRGDCIDLTGEMRAQLNEMRVERVFDLFETLHNDARWREFLNEAFHHTLRALRAPL